MGIEFIRCTILAQGPLSGDYEIIYGMKWKYDSFYLLENYYLMSEMNEIIYNMT